MSFEDTHIEDRDRLEGPDLRLEEAIKLKSLLSGFENSEIWKAFSGMLDGQIRNRQQHIMLTPLKNFLEGGAQEYMKGEVHAFMLMKEMPEVLVNAADGIIEAFRSQKETKDGGHDNSTSDRDLRGERAGSP